MLRKKTHDKLALASMICMAAFALAAFVFGVGGAGTHERYVAGVTPISDFESGVAVGDFEGESGPEYTEPALVGGIAKLVILVNVQSRAGSTPLHWEQISLDGGSHWLPFGNCYTIHGQRAQIAYLTTEYLKLSPPFPPGTLFRVGVVRPDDPLFTATVTLGSGDDPEHWRRQFPSALGQPQIRVPGCRYWSR